MKNKWEVVHESDTESGNPTCWALEINHEIHGKYVWIVGWLDNDEETIIEYTVENDKYVLVKCKSLASAKRWVSRYLL